MRTESKGTHVPRTVAAWIHGLVALTLFACLPQSEAVAQTITEIIDSAGDPNRPVGLSLPRGVAVDSSGNVYVAGRDTHNVYRIASPGTCSTGAGDPNCTITEIIDPNGDWAGNILRQPQDLDVDSSGNVYVAGFLSNNAFKIATPGTCSTAGPLCTITKIIDSGGSGNLGETLSRAGGVAVDSAGNVYVTGTNGSNVFKIEPGGTIRQIMKGGSLQWPKDVAVDSSGNVYVAASGTKNAFKIEAPGTCSTSGTACVFREIINSNGDGMGNDLKDPRGVAVDAGGNVYLTDFKSSPDSDVFKIDTPGACGTGAGDPNCTITQIIDSTGDGAGNSLDGASSVAVDSSGNVYVTGSTSDNAFKIDPGGTITEIIDTTGDSGPNSLFGTHSVAVDSSGNVYVTGETSDNAFRIGPSPAAVPAVGTRGIALLAAAFVCAALWWIPRRLHRSRLERSTDG